MLFSSNRIKMLWFNSIYRRRQWSWARCLHGISGCYHGSSSWYHGSSSWYHRSSSWYHGSSSWYHGNTSKHRRRIWYSYRRRIWHWRGRVHRNSKTNHGHGLWIRQHWKPRTYNGRFQLVLSKRHEKPCTIACSRNYLRHEDDSHMGNFCLK